jgi:hypothetical protein
VPVRVEGYVALLREIVTGDAIVGVRAEAKKRRHVPATFIYPFVADLHVPETFIKIFVIDLHEPETLIYKIYLAF